MNLQSSSKVLMIRPFSFVFNEETALDNYFQKRDYSDDVPKQALIEFDNFVKLLQQSGVEVVVIEDSSIPHTPDSIFPNNWFSTHQSGDLILYPMFAPNRRSERKEAPLNYLYNLKGVKRVIDLTSLEQSGHFLEGTGSLILDRVNLKGYASLSSRTTAEAIERFEKESGYTITTFSSYDNKGALIYHTNVMMSLGTQMAIIALDAITNPSERQRVVEEVEQSGREILEITLEQLTNFAGNAIELLSNKGEPIVVISERGWNSLNQNQRSRVEQRYKTVIPNLSTIEESGGGSARCMVAELFL